MKDNHDNINTESFRDYQDLYSCSHAVRKYPHNPCIKKKERKKWLAIFDNFVKLTEAFA